LADHPSFTVPQKDFRILSQADPEEAVAAEEGSPSVNIASRVLYRTDTSASCSSSGNL
jgi:hypothetical protein